MRIIKVLKKNDGVKKTVKKKDASSDKVIETLYSGILKDITNIKLKLDKTRNDAKKLIEVRGSGPAPIAMETAKELLKQIEEALSSLSVID